MWLCHRFCLRVRKVEELLALPGGTVTDKTVRQWCQKFWLADARKLRKQQGWLGEPWQTDEIFVNIQGDRYDLWRAVDQDGDTIDLLIQRHPTNTRRNVSFAAYSIGPGEKPDGR